MKDNIAIGVAAGLFVILAALVLSLDALFPEPPLDLSSLRVNASLLGSDSPITIVVFTDYQCEPCKALYPSLARIQREYGQQLKLITHFMPAEPEALELGLAAACGNDAYKSYLYLAPSKDRIGAYAAMAGLDNETFLSCMKNESTKEKVMEGIKLGSELGVTGIPTLFMNGVRVDGAASYSELKLLMDSELK